MMVAMVPAVIMIVWVSVHLIMGVVLVVMRVALLRCVVRIARGRRSLGRATLAQPELGRGDPGPIYSIGLDRPCRISERQAPERRAQVIERQARVEQRAEHHVAGSARETVEISDAAHVTGRRVAFRVDLIP
jgi:hypothetical protein